MHKFRTHVDSLYSAEKEFCSSEADALFSCLNFPVLSQTEQDWLEDSITAEEVSKAIKELKWNKRPGPDGYSAIYYCTSSEIVPSVLTKAFNIILKGHSFNQLNLTVIVCMIPKPHSDNTSCTNYHLISFLNIDIKNLAKILATRLNGIIGRLIHCDQMSFVPVHQASDRSRTRHIPACFLSRYSESFWLYITALYNKPFAYVKYAGYKSDPFNIERATRPSHWTTSQVNQVNPKRLQE